MNYYYSGNVIKEEMSSPMPNFTGGSYAGWERGEYEIDLARYNHQISQLKTFDCTDALKRLLGSTPRYIEIDKDLPGCIACICLTAGNSI